VCKLKFPGNLVYLKDWHSQQLGGSNERDCYVQAGMLSGTNKSLHSPSHLLLDEGQVFELKPCLKWTFGSAMWPESIY
jgi:hypothetical protein